MFRRKNIVLTRPAAGSAGAPQREPVEKTHPGIRPSLVNSKPCVSSGSRSLDKALAHGGVPLGSVTLIEEYGTTDFSSALLKSLCTSSVVETRGSVDSKVICVGIPEWLRTLPGIGSGRRKSSSSSSSSKGSDQKMKIAWRYAKYAKNGDEVESPSPYCPDFDFKSTLIPAAQQREAVYVLGNSLPKLLEDLRKEVELTSKNTLLRIVVPSFLHPAIYPSRTCSTPQQLYPFFAHLREIVQAHGRAVAFVSLPLQLYPRTQSLVGGLELLCDTCIEIEPFESGDDNVQGFLNINKLAALTDRGEMAEQRHELSFRLGRHQFVVEPYAIPVELQEEGTSVQENW